MSNSVAIQEEVMSNNETTESDAGKEEDKPPKNNFVYTAMVLGGLGYQLPNYCIVSTVDYYQVRYPGHAVMLDMMAARHITSVIGYFVNNALLEACGLTQRIMFPNITSLVFLLFLTVCEASLQLFNQQEGYAVLMLVLSVECMMAAMQQSSFYGYVNMLPARYIQALAVGEGTCGLLVNLLRLITKACVTSLQVNTVVFLVTGIVLTIICCAVFLTARRANFVQYYVRKCQSENSPSRPTTYSALSNNCEKRAPLHKGEQREENGSVQNINHDVTRSAVMKFQEEKVDTGNTSEKTHLIDGRSVPAQGTRTSLLVKIKVITRRRWDIIQQIHKLVLVVALNYFISLALFSIGVANIVSCSLGTWMPIVLMSVYDVGDLAGRIVVSWKLVQKIVLRILPPGSLSRFVFFPLVLLCCLPRLHPVIDHEAWSCLILILLGLTNGLFLVVSLSDAPTRVALCDREICGNTMMIAAMFTMVLGVLAAYVLDETLNLRGNLDVCASDWANITIQNNITLN